MNLDEVIRLIRPAFKQKSVQRWADLGCGSGLFTLALLQELEHGSKIVALDQNISDFNWDQIPEDRRFEIILLQEDMNNFQASEILDGILMANSLHFIKDKLSFLKTLIPTLNDVGSVIIIEYDTDRSNPWVPYPVKLKDMQSILSAAGFKSSTVIGFHPSRYLGRMYSIHAEV